MYALGRASGWKGTARLCQFIIFFELINMSLVKVDSMRGAYRSEGLKKAFGYRHCRVAETKQSKQNRLIIILFFQDLLKI